MDNLHKMISNIATHIGKWSNSIWHRLKEQKERLKKILLISLVAIGFCTLLYVVWGALPRYYMLRITGGEILGNRHFLVKLLQNVGKDYGLSLVITPTSGSFQALEAVDKGKLDVAVIQGGLNTKYPNVVHVATIAPEILHLLVKPTIKTVSDLKGKTISMGSKRGGTRLAAKDVLAFSELKEGKDYKTIDYSLEELTSIWPAKLPDAIFVLSTIPSDFVDFMVKERGYDVLEIPFPDALGYKYGWVANSVILPFTYRVNPAVPATLIKGVGINMIVVANRNVDPKAIYALLRALYSKALASRLRIDFDPSIILKSSFYPESSGTKKYIARDDPIFSPDIIDKFLKIGYAIALAASLYELIRRLLKKKDIFKDKEFKAYLEQIAAINKDLEKLSLEKTINQAALHKLANQVTSIKTKMLEEYPNAKLADPSLVPNIMQSLSLIDHDIMYLAKKSE